MTTSENACQKPAGNSKRLKIEKDNFKTYFTVFYVMSVCNILIFSQTLQLHRKFHYCHKMSVSLQWWWKCAYMVESIANCTCTIIRICTHATVQYSKTNANYFTKIIVGNWDISNNLQEN